MADAPAVVNNDSSKSSTGVFDIVIKSLVWIAGVIVAWWVVKAFLLPIVSEVPIGTWLWRVLVILAISFGGYNAGKLWFEYIRAAHIEGLKWTLLYIKIPRTNPRSIEAMEMMLNALWDTGGTGTWRNLFWDGAVRKWATLEIVSVEGKIYYFIRCLSGNVDFVKSQIYAQFPDTEITPVDDYVNYVPPYEAATSKDWTLNGYEIEMEKGELFPIKTYRDWGLDKPGKPEERIDPLANILEAMGMIGPGEQFWIQIHIRAAADRFDIKDSKKKKTLAKNLDEQLKKFEEDMIKRIKEDTTSPDIEFSKKRITEYLTQYEKDIYESLQRHKNKRAFDVGMRCIYIAKKDMAKGTVAGAVAGALRLFSAPGMNGLKDMNNTLGFAHPWNNAFGEAGNARRDDLYQAYIHRSYFYPPFNGVVDAKPKFVPRKIMVMSTEELATIFHFPGEEVKTGGLSRVEARKAEPPANLPIA